MRDLGERRDFVGLIDRAGFARLGQRERRRDHLVRGKIAITGKRGLQGVRRDLAGLAGQPRELQSAAKEFRRAALIGGDVGFRRDRRRRPKAA